MNQNSLKLLEKTFKKYYFEHFNILHVPTNSSEREFAYKKFDSTIHRHISLKSDKELHLLLMTNSPSDVFCSNAYYYFPTLSMKEKGWKGADLIFDIDSKDLKLHCRSSHTCIKCTNCNVISHLHSTCPNCNSHQIKIISLSCTNCINAAKIEVNKLLIMLVDDFGIPIQNIKVFFSGNDGFHISVYDLNYQNLESRERADLVDYILLRDTLLYNISNKLRSINSLNDIYGKGLLGRIYKQLVKKKYKNPTTIRKIIMSDQLVPKLNMIRHEINAKIDPTVTTDIHRVFRLEGSINSKSGLSKILLTDINELDPFSEACMIDDDLTYIIANSPIKFTLKNRSFGPFQDQKIEIPKYAAVYMICKGLADAI